MNTKDWQDLRAKIHNFCDLRKKNSDWILRNKHFVLTLCILKYVFEMAEVKFNRIKVALAEKDRPNKWLANKLGKTEMTVSRWVSNKSQPSLEQLFEIAKVLEMDVRMLINTSDDVAALTKDVDE